MTCSGCGVEKDPEAFQRRRSGGRTGHYSRCRQCSNATSMEWRRKNPDYHGAWRAANPGYMNEWRYGISGARYDEMLASQNGACAICRQTFTTTPCIDHDHSCCPGKKACGDCVRALLCRQCNTALGALRDDVRLARAAAAYLEAHA